MISRVKMFWPAGQVELESRAQLPYLKGCGVMIIFRIANIGISGTIKRESPETVSPKSPQRAFSWSLSLLGEKFGAARPITQLSERNSLYLNVLPCFG